MAASKYLVESYDQMLGRGEDKSMEAFTKGALGVLKNDMMAEQKQKASMQAGHEKDIENLEKIGNLGSLSKDEKKITRQWLRGQRDEYYKISQEFQKTKNPELQDKMDDINDSILTAGANVKRYNDNTKKWAGDVGNVAYGSRTFDFESTSDIFGKKGGHTMSWDEGGDLSFIGAPQDTDKVLSGEVTGGNKIVLFNDIDDGWELNNSKMELFESDMRNNIETNKAKGKFFSKTKTQGDLYNKLVESGPEGIQVFAETDLTGTYGQENLSFQKLWENGKMGGEFYKEFPLDKGSDWMFDNANSDRLAGLMSKHMANTHEELNNKFEGPTETYTKSPGTAGAKDATRKMNQSKVEQDDIYSEMQERYYDGTKFIGDINKFHGEIVDYYSTRLKKGYDLINEDGTYYITEQIPDFSDPLNPKYSTKKSKIQGIQGSGRGMGYALDFKNIWRFMDQDMVTLSSENNVMFKKD